MSTDIKRLSSAELAARTSTVARAIIDFETQSRDAKTAKLKQARLQRDEAIEPAQPDGETQEKPARGKSGKT